MPRFGLILLCCFLVTIPAIPMTASADDDPMGACCIPPSFQCFVTTHSQCDAWGGYWSGDGVTCVPYP